MKLKRQIAMGLLAVMLMMLIPAGAFAQQNEAVSESSLKMNMVEPGQIKIARYDDSVDIYYRSKDMKVASVNAAGKVTAHAPGVTEIMIYSSDRLVDECLVTVENPDGTVWVSYDSAAVPEEPTHYYFYQGDSAWGFSRAVRKKACVLTSMAMLLKNVGEDTDPKQTYKNNGNNSGMNFTKVLKYYGRNYSAALPHNSEYMKSYDVLAGTTYINNPKQNYEAAVKEALKEHPEGVICYFVKSDSRRHAIVAIGVDEDGNIRYNDAGRLNSKGQNITFKNTWCSYKHKMTYEHFAYFIAIN